MSDSVENSIERIDNAVEEIEDAYLAMTPEDQAEYGDVFEVIDCIRATNVRFLEKLARRKMWANLRG